MKELLKQAVVNVAIAGIKEEAFDIEAILYEKLVVDRHCEELCHLERFLRLQTDSAERQHLIEELKKSKDQESSLQAQYRLIEVIEGKKTLPKKTSLSLLKEVDRLLNLKPNHPFKNDLEMLKAFFSAQPQRNFPSPLQIRDDPASIFLTGTEVAGSCQNIAGAAQRNQGLIGFFNGRNLPLGHVNAKTGAWESRVLLRLALAKDVNRNEEAVLLFERIYPGTATMLQKAELKEAAILLSDYLGLKVVGAQGEGAAFDKRLFLDQDLFNCEYVDAAWGLIERFPCNYLQDCKMLK